MGETAVGGKIAKASLGQGDVELLNRRVMGAGYYHHKRAAVMGLCAVEMAMWDAQGRHARPHDYSGSSNPGSGGGGEIIGTILRQTPEVDAVIFAGHQIAIGAIRHASDIGIDVPGRVAIAGFGESPMARWIRPSLTTVRFPVKEMGTEAGRLILARLAGQRLESRSIRLGFEILERESA